MLVLHEKAGEPAETELVEPFQLIGHRRAGDEGALPPLADESTAAH